MEEKSAASTIRAAPAVEQPESPPHPPPPTGIPAMPPEVAQALAVFFIAMAGQAQTGQVPPIVPPATPTVPPMPDISISKKLKEAREFDGQYYTHFHQKEKRREFLDLKQGNLTVEEYKARFNELMLYVPDLVKSEQDQASYFEEELRNEIRE
ncbi:Gag protease polyprotein [Theobroma cacao]|uniref:Gag protease polyprotein n=1 Tax=Theobroma cacao TaxID=3641 RepID=A0A061GH59_THECC|nr:Gag protease polyprotein [Theobroma cacao]